MRYVLLSCTAASHPACPTPTPPTASPHLQGVKQSHQRRLVERQADVRSKQEQIAAAAKVGDRGGGPELPRSKQEQIAAAAKVLGWGSGATKMGGCMQQARWGDVCGGGAGAAEGMGGVCVGVWGGVREILSGEGSAWGGISEGRHCTPTFMLWALCPAPRPW